MTKRILVVEDDDAFRRLVVRMLADCGFEVVEAAGFATATKVIESREHVDLLFADIGMPGGTPHGVSIARVAQRHRKGLKVLFMTGGCDPSQISLFSEDDPVLRKPFTQEELADAVIKALG